jgi:endonuclease/exonuclease/phosphatase (EEP) superfamily protein YafD
LQIYFKSTWKDQISKKTFYFNVQDWRYFFKSKIVMQKISKILHTTFIVIVAIIAVFAILSIFRNTESRYLKYLDFPRIQFFLVSILFIALVVIFVKQWKWKDYLVLFLLFITLTINGFYLINYTFLVSEKVPTAVNLKESDHKIGLLLSNVKMSNRKADPLLNLIQNKKPDLVLVMEVDKWWDEHLKVLEKEYPFSHHTINEVTYGMVLYSKFPLEEVDVNYLQNKKVPSFKSTVILDEDKKIIFHAIHPVPPTYFKDLPDNEGQQETALQKLGSKLDNSQYPIIVAGDFNDVVWSYVNKLTETENILFDVRVGRGFYNSYNAENIVMRWPLDHIFVTKEFRLKKLERLPKIGSDHFPIFAELVL